VASSGEANWSWSGNLSDESKRAEYRGLVTISTQDRHNEISIHLSNGVNSFFGKATKASLSGGSSSEIAYVEPGRRLEKIKQAFES